MTNRNRAERLADRMVSWFHPTDVANEFGLERLTLSTHVMYFTSIGVLEVEQYNTRYRYRKSITRQLILNVAEVLLANDAMARLAD